LIASSCLGKKDERPCTSGRFIEVHYQIFPRLKKKKMTSQLRSILFQVFAYWIQPNKERLNKKRRGKMEIFYVRQV